MIVTASLQKKILLGCILAASSLLVFTITSAVRHRNLTQAPQANLPSLPPDVDRVLEGYRHAETNRDLAISISGKRIVTRGRKLLGLRSNVIKSNFFEGIEGTVTTPRRTLAFSASDAEWDAQSAHPFILKKNVSIVLDGEPVPGVKTARLHFKQGTLEVQRESGKKTYALK